MDCKIMKKEAFTVLCRAKTFKYEDAAAQVPQFWAEHFGTGGGKFENGAQNQDYYCEVWTPVERNKINRFSKKIQDYDKNRNFDTIDIRIAVLS